MSDVTEQVPNGRDHDREHHPRNEDLGDDHHEA